MTGTIWSFDVYETLICRAFGDHASMGLLLGRLGRERRVHDVEAARFAVARVDGEARARHRSPHGETTLEQIHREVAVGLGLPPSVVASLCALELELEERAARTHDGAIAMVQRARQRGARIVFTSDMYLPEDFIRSSLERFGLYRDGDGLYVSSARGGARKRHGKLFQVVLAAERAEPKDVLHIGNRLDVDVLPARRLGLRARHLPAGDLNRYERALEARAVGTAGLSSMFAGASRQTRLSVPADDEHDAMLRDVAAGVVAPTLTGFALWLLQRVAQDGVKRLYFLAREGQPMQAVVEQLVERLGLEVELRYLYVSRQSLNAAGASTIDVDELRWVLSHARHDSVRTILTRLGVHLEDVSDFLTSRGWSVEELHEPVGRERLPELLEQLSSDPLRSLVGTGVTAMREAALEYLDQEGVFDPATVGLVDATGTGSQIRAIARLRQHRGMSAPRAYLIFRSATDGADEDRQDTGIDAWLGDQVADLGYGALPGRAALMEVVCTADHGTVLGYERVGSSVVPRLGHGLASQRAAWGLPKVRAATEEFIRHLCLDADLVDLDADMRGATVDLLTTLWDTPTPPEAQVWGRFPFEGASGDGREVVALAQPHRLGSLPEVLRHRRLTKREWFEWPSASVQNSPAATRLAIRAIRVAKRRARRVLRLAAVNRLVRRWRT